MTKWVDRQSMGHKQDAYIFASGWTHQRMILDGDYWSWSWPMLLAFTNTGVLAGISQSYPIPPTETVSIEIRHLGQWMHVIIWSCNWWQTVVSPNSSLQVWTTSLKFSLSLHRMVRNQQKIDIGLNIYHLLWIKCPTFSASKQFYVVPRQIDYKQMLLFYMNKWMKSLLFYQTRQSSYRNRAYELINLNSATNKAELSLTFIQQPGVDWEHLTRASLLLLQQLLQTLTALPQSNPTLSNEHRKVFFLTRFRRRFKNTNNRGTAKKKEYIIKK
jgi:hypothetical protein